MKPKRRFWILIVLPLAVIAVTGVYWIRSRQSGPEPVAENEQAETAVARLGDLSILASGSGQVVPASEAALGFDESGVLTEILVNLGQEVQAGEVLARMQINKTQAQIAADLASAKLAVVQAQQTLDQLNQSAELETAQARVTLDEAQTALDELLDTTPEKAAALQNLADAQQAIDDAKMTLYILNSSPSQDALDIAYASYLFKEQTLEEIQEQADKLEYQIKTAPNKEIKDRLTGQLLRVNVQLTQQQLVVENAQYKYDTLDDAADPVELTVAEARLKTGQSQFETAQREWEKIQNGPESGEVALAEAALSEAQAEWERLKDGPDPEEIAVAETQLEQAKLELELAQQSQRILELAAPIDGTVISIDANVGARIGAETLITLADLSQPYLEVFMDETDFDKVQSGNSAQVTFESLPDEVFTGIVVEVDPGLSEANRVQAIRALVRLDESSYAKPVSLPIGLNAAVDVIAGQATNVVLVPIEALQEINPGEYGIYVMENNQPEFRQVSVGLIDYTSAEITSGLEAGEIVTIK